MSQRDALREFDAFALEAFIEAGMADVGVYTSPAGVVTPECPVLIDREAQQFGEFGAVVGERTEITFFRSVVEVQNGGNFALDGEVWKLEQRVARDESHDRWVVNKAGAQL